MGFEAGEDGGGEEEQERGESMRRGEVFAPLRSDSSASMRHDAQSQLEAMLDCMLTTMVGRNGSLCAQSQDVRACPNAFPGAEHYCVVLRRFW